MNHAISINIYLRQNQYEKVKELGKKFDKPYSAIVREGTDLILAEYEKSEGKNETVE